MEAGKLSVTDGKLPVTDGKLPVTDGKLPVTSGKLPVKKFPGLQNLPGFLSKQAGMAIPAGSLLLPRIRSPGFQSPFEVVTI